MVIGRDISWEEVYEMFVWAAFSAIVLTFFLKIVFEMLMEQLARPNRGRSNR